MSIAIAIYLNNIIAKKKEKEELIEIQGGEEWATGCMIEETIIY